MLRDRLGRTAVLALCGGSIAALLAELYDVAQMAPVFVLVTIPSSVALAAIGMWRSPLRGAVRVGAIGGLLGTVAYDVFRIPFMLAGMRVFAPISSYGLMAAAADQSTGVTTVLGWSYHLSNGVAFGIAYMLLASRRSRWWAVAWGVGLETVAFLGPFTARYGLSGKAGPIAVAFAAHVAYGLPLGVVGERYGAVEQWIKARRWVVARSLAVAVGVIVLVFSPWSSNPAHREALALADQLGEPVAVVDGSKFEPEWLRVAPGGCATVVNPSAESADTTLGVVPAGGSVRWCLDDPVVHRVKIEGRPWSGGFILVDG